MGECIEQREREKEAVRDKKKRTKIHLFLCLQISECGFMERNYLNIEQSDLEAFYHKFSLQHQKTATGKFKHVGDFLKGIVEI